MDERAIYEEILGQLAIIVNQQTQDIVNSINNKKTGEQQQIEVLVSGNTMSVIDVVTNNPETAKRVENVASSFEVLNQQLEKYESIFKGIQGARYNGAGGQVEYIVDFLNILSDVDYISKIAKANEILESQKDVVSRFFNIFTDDEFVNSLKQSSSIIESETNRIRLFLEAFMEFATNPLITGFDFKNNKVVEYINSFGELKDTDFDFSKSNVHAFLKSFIELYGNPNISGFTFNGNGMVEYINSFGELKDTDFDFKNSNIYSLLKAFGELQSNPLVSGFDWDSRKVVEYVNSFSELKDTDFDFKNSNIYGLLKAFGELQSNPLVSGFDFKNNKVIEYINSFSELKDMGFDFEVSNVYKFLRLFEELTKNPSVVGFDFKSNRIVDYLNEFNDIKDIDTESYNKVFDVIRSFGEIYSNPLISGFTFNGNGMVEYINSFRGLKDTDFDFKNSNIYSLLKVFGEMYSNPLISDFDLDSRKIVEYVNSFGELKDTNFDFKNSNVFKFLELFSEISKNPLIIGFDFKNNRIVEYVNSFGELKDIDIDVEDMKVLKFIKEFGNMRTLVETLNSMTLDSKVISSFFKSVADIANEPSVSGFSFDINGNGIGAVMRFVDFITSSDIKSKLDAVKTFDIGTLRESVSSFGDLIGVINGFGVIEDSQKLNVKFILDFIGYLGSENVADSISKIRGLMTKEIVDTISGFFKGIEVSINSVNEIGGVQKDTVKYITALLEYISGLSNISMNVPEWFNAQGAERLSEFFGQYASRINTLKIEDDAIRNVKTIFDILGVVSNNIDRDKIGSITGILDKSVADSIADFFTEFADRIGKTYVDAKSLGTVSAFVGLVNGLSDEGFVSRFGTVVEYLNHDNATRISEFFKTFASEMNSGPQIIDDNIESVRRLMNIIESVGNADFISRLHNVIQSLSSEDYSVIYGFFKEFASKVSEIQSLGESQVTNIESLIGLIDKISNGTDFSGFGKFAEKLDTDSAVAFGEFFVELSKRLSKIGEITKQNKDSINFIRALVNTIGSDVIAQNVEKISEWAVADNAVKLGEFFLRLSETLENVHGISEEQSKSVKSMIDIIGLMAQSKIFDAVESSSSLSEKKGRRIGEFFAAMSESLNYIPEIGKKQVETIDAMIKILTFVTQEDLMKRISKTGSMKTKTARNIGNFFGAFADAISEVEVADAAQIKNLLNLMSLLDIVTREGFVSKMVVANMFIGRRTGRSIGEFFGAFAESISSIPEFSDGNKKTVAAMLSLIGVVTGEGFLRKMVLANIFIGKKTATSIGEFFQTFGNLIASTPELTDDKLKAIRAYQTLISGIIADGVATNIWITSLILGKNTGRRIGEFFAQLADELSGIDSGTNVLASVKNITEFLSIVSSVKFILRIKSAKKFYGKTLTGDWKNDPKMISEWFKEFFAGFDKEQLDIRTDVLKDITVFLDKVSSPMFMAKLVLATFVYERLNANAIGDFFSTFINRLDGVFSSDVDKIKNINKNVQILSDVIDGILSITGKLLWLGVIGTVMIFALPGLAVIGDVLFGLTWIMDFMVNKMTKNGQEYSDALSTLNDCLLKLSFSLLLVTAAMILADRIGMGALKIIIPMLGIVALFGIIVLIDKMSKKFNVTGAITDICVDLVLLSLAMVALAAAMVIANNIEGQGMVMFFGVLLGLVAIVGILALIQMTGIGPAAALAGLAIAGVMLVMTFVMLIVLKCLELAASAVKELPKIKMLIVGLVDIMWEIGLKAALLGLVSPLLVLFAASTMMLLMVSVLAVAVGKIARLFTVKDKQALKNVIKSMIEVFDMVDEYFDSKTFGSSVPVVGTVLKLVNALGASVNLILFSVSLGVLLTIATMAVVVGKISRLSNAKDFRSLKDVISGLIDIFDMVDEHFSSNTFGSGIPVVGTVLKLFNALGSALSLILFSVSLGVLMTVVTLTIGVAKLARVVKKKDIESLKDVISGMIDIFDMVGGSFLFGLLDNISKAASAGLFAAAMVPILGITTWFINLTKKYYEADAKVGGIGKVSQKMIADLKGFMDKFNDSFSIWDAVATGVTSVIVSSMIPMLMTLGKFIDIVAKVATMTVMTGYDRNGKPMFQRIAPSAFMDAANVVVGGFSLFLTKMNQAFSGDLSKLSTQTIKHLGKAMIPLMEAMSDYVDSIVKLSTSTVTIGFDEKGKPKYKQLDFGPNGDAYKASNALTSLFLTFMTSFVANTNQLEVNSKSTMKKLAESMVPLMTGVSSFADAIVKMGTSMIPCAWDKDGKPIKYTNVSPEVYQNAAQVLASNFGAFISKLREESDKMMGSSKNEAECLSKCMTELMTGVGDFADAIVKLGTAGTPVYKNGKIDHYEKIDAVACANAIVGESGIFTVFLKTLNEGFDNLNAVQVSTIQQLAETMEPLMTGVSMFADTIIKMARGTYVDHYDKNGKPVNKVIPTSAYKESAEIITSSFMVFVTTMKDRLHASKDKISETLDALNKGGIAEVMTSVGNFVNALSKFAGGKFYVIKEFDKKGNPVYLKENGKLKTINMEEIAKNIANGFTVFVSTLAEKLGDATVKSKIEGAKTVIEQLEGVMDPVGKFADTVLKFKDNDKQNFAELGTRLGQGLINILKGMDEDASVAGGLIAKYGDAKFIDNLESVCGGLDTVNSCLEDFIDIKVKEDIVKKAQDAGTALISLFRYLDGGLETSGLISVYGNPEMINKIYNMSLNINTALDVLDRFRDFEKYDFKSVLNSEKDFAEAVRFLMTIDFQSYEPKFGSSVNKVIQHLSNADKQMQKSMNFTNRMRDSVSKAIDTIESKLAKGEKLRNEKFQTLVKNLDAVANKLGEVQKGLMKLKNDNFQWIANMNKQIEEMNKLQSQMSSQSFSFNTSSGGSQGNAHSGGGITFDGKTPIPVYLVNAPQSNGNEKIGLLIEVDGKSYRASASPSLLGIK